MAQEGIGSFSQLPLTASQASVVHRLPSVQSHEMHATAPVLGWNSSVGHGLHTADPVAAANVPGAQGEHAVPPSFGWNCPAGQGSHGSWPVTLNVPG